MTVPEIFGVARTVLTMAQCALTMRKVWWAPIYKLSIQPVWIAYCLMQPVTYSLLPISGWQIFWSATAIRKWKRERVKHG